MEVARGSSLDVGESAKACVFDPNERTSLKSVCVKKGRARKKTSSGAQVNSGSEANDLALRLARNYTGKQEVRD